MGPMFSHLKNKVRWRMQDLNVLRKADFKLYFLQYCYFCQIVREAARELDIKLQLIDIAQDGAARERLMEVRGRTTVPVLRIDTAEEEKWLPESRDIIRYLKDFAADRKKLA